MHQVDQASVEGVEYMRAMTEELAQAADRLNMPVVGWLYRVAVAAIDDCTPKTPS